MADDLRLIVKTPRYWRGNGFGYSPATYHVMRDLKKIGELSCLGRGYDWMFRPQEPSEATRYFRTKAEARKALAAVAHVSEEA